ncbi:MULTISPECIES: radical SAM protein [unclassified Amycolatopsis]|uniref:radical SAM protein n=1 Tax=unclassified Amycolatopsis TaxID=2618356 RepID=UPI002E0FB9AF|nr:MULTISPECIES: radical SAM protein [unclassified Amycolatopsis]WSJ80129.1 radical SAM protein [Amycolatopsis sp. NBC_01307]WSK76392.1 radical SAM protein [Amycolatopsis sp. NBC_01286]
MTLAYEEAIGSLHGLDPAWPRPAVLDVLEAPENRHLLDYVQEDPFGAHVFPGNVPGYAPADFLRDLDAQLASSAPIHLWSYIPTCAYRCRFCQYPVVLVKGKPEVTYEKAKHWVDLNIREARMWLDAVPNLAGAEVGEFNVFGGTPSLLPEPEIRRLLDFYREEFGFTADTTIRFEGDPSTFTPAKLELLRDLGCTKLSSGVQSFDDHVLELCGREHSARMCVDFVRNAQRLGFEWVSIDLMYGLLDQTLDSVRRDLDVVLENEITAVVCTKLHLASYSDTRTGVTGEKPAAWQLPSYRDKLVRDGHRWPTLGEQYQMRELLTDGLRAANYTEHPTMYFARDGLGPEKWKSIMVDQEKQEAEVAIGLGGSSSCRASEAITDVNSKRYIETVEAGRIPLGSATRFTPDGQEARAVKMALTTLQPLRDSVHASRFPGRSLFAEPWLGKFRSLADRGLVRLDSGAGKVELTRTGEVLVEAIITTEL